VKLAALEGVIAHTAVRRSIERHIALLTFAEVAKHSVGFPVVGVAERGAAAAGDQEHEVRVGRGNDALLALPAVAVVEVLAPTVFLTDFEPHRATLWPLGVLRLASAARTALNTDPAWFALRQRLGQQVPFRAPHPL
jgi:hypothetical protein